MHAEPSAVPGLAPMRSEITGLFETARSLPIHDEPTFQAASTCLVRIKTLRTRLEELLAPHIKRAFEAHRALVEDRRRLDAPLTDAETMLKRRLAEFTVAEEARRAIESRRHSVEAQEARSARIWAEVEALESDGYHDEAAEVVAEFVHAPAPLLISLPARVTAPGISCREVWRYAVEDPAQIPREYLTIDHTKLGGVVRALKSAASIPGVRVWVERTIAAARR
jgi:hypothetical protein